LYAHRYLINQVDFAEFESEVEEGMMHSERHLDAPPSEEDNEEYWSSFIRRAESRVRKFQYDNEQRFSGLEGGERLWEIGCRVCRFVEFGPTCY
jgi:hypothetical protein